MPKTKTPARLAIDQALADGDWHHRGTIIELAARSVPPGAASRRTQAMRDRHAFDRPEIRHDNVAVGARDIARSVLVRAVRRGTVEQRELDGVLEVRRRPT